MKRGSYVCCPGLRWNGMRSGVLQPDSRAIPYSAMRVSSRAGTRRQPAWLRPLRQHLTPFARPHQCRCWCLQGPCRAGRGGSAAGTDPGSAGAGGPARSGMWCVRLPFRAEQWHSPRGSPPTSGTKQPVRWRQRQQRQQLTSCRMSGLAVDLPSASTAVAPCRQTMAQARQDLCCVWSATSTVHS